ncbi:MAG: aminotransferase class I/II-fold pyridoxal phosphate-dependent enzyme [Candidatus Marinimicrobia bacterium]|nr:aminotransferase class I/II-fold pyridoxal phosphate-dependent enzyme [Candidatus Neomarinimicrobiota bacterium]
MKYDAVEKVFGTRDLIPLWVADMDIPAPLAVRLALLRRVLHPIYGYSIHNKCFFNSIEKWLNEQYDYQIRKEWVTCTPGIVPALNIAVMSLTEEGDEVIIQPPVYPPFFNAVSDHGRILVTNPLKETNGYYTMDLEDLKKRSAIKQNY